MVIVIGVHRSFLMREIVRLNSCSSGHTLGQSVNRQMYKCSSMQGAKSPTEFEILHGFFLQYLVYSNFHGWLQMGMLLMVCIPQSLHSNYYHPEQIGIVYVCLNGACSFGAMQ